MHLMKRDKKVKDNQIRFILLKSIGRAYVEQKVPKNLIKKAIVIHKT